MKNLFAACILVCCLMSCSKEEALDEFPDVNYDVWFDPTFEEISNIQINAGKPISYGPPNRTYTGFKFNRDSTVSFIGLNYSTTPVYNSVTKDTDKTILKFKTKTSGNLDAIDFELLKRYDLLIYQEFGGLTDIEKADYISKNPKTPGDKMKMMFAYLKITSITSEVKFEDQRNISYTVAKK